MCLCADVARLSAYLTSGESTPMKNGITLLYRDTDADEAGALLPVVCCSPFLAANSYSSAIMSIVLLALGSSINSARGRASLARSRQWFGSVACMLAIGFTTHQLHFIPSM